MGIAVGLGYLVFFVIPAWITGLPESKFPSRSAIAYDGVFGDYGGGFGNDGGGFGDYGGGVGNDGGGFGGHNGGFGLEVNPGDSAEPSNGCSCHYVPFSYGCVITSPAPAGRACQCTVHFGPVCEGRVVPCLHPKEPSCTSPGIGLKSCEQAAGANCSGYTG